MKDGIEVKWEEDSGKKERERRRKGIRIAEGGKGDRGGKGKRRKGEC